MNGVWYYDFWRGCRSIDPSLLFPGWGEYEHVAVLSPHDDDALLGAGYAILAARELGAAVTVMIVCDGRAGYSSPEQKSRIVATRREETLVAYSHLGLRLRDIHRFNVPDFSVVSHIAWQLPGGREGIITDLIIQLRQRKISRFFIPNGFSEHLDHEATYDLGRYASSQTGDPILVDMARPFAVRSVHVYSVWGDFPAPHSEAGGANLRANKALVVPSSWEEKVQQGIRSFRSQGAIIENLVEGRKARQCSGGFLELYLDLDPRPGLDYEPYVTAADRIRTMSKRKA